MAIAALDGSGNPIFLEASGDGSAQSPFVRTVADINSAANTVTFGQINSRIGTIQTNIAEILLDSANVDTNVGAIATSATAILADTAQLDTNIAAILADTAQLDINLANANTSLTAILADTAGIGPDVAAILSDTATIDSNVGSISSNLGAVLADTSSLDTKTTTISNNLAAVLTDTGTINSSVVAVNTNVGTVNTNISNILADTAAIDTNVATIAGAIAGSEIQTDIVSMPPVTVAARSIIPRAGSINTSGDNTIVDVTAVAGYTSGDSLVVPLLVLQNESSTAVTATAKNGATIIGRALLQNKGDTMIFDSSLGDEWRLNADTDLVISLSGPNAVGYTIKYFLE
jgi:hypothetical protein